MSPSAKWQNAFLDGCARVKLFAVECPFVVVKEHSPLARAARNSTAVRIMGLWEKRESELQHASSRGGGVTVDTVDEACEQRHRMADGPPFGGAEQHIRVRMEGLPSGGLRLRVGKAGQLAAPAAAPCPQGPGRPRAGARVAIRKSNQCSKFGSERKFLLAGTVGAWG